MSPAHPPTDDVVDVALVFPPHWYYPHVPHELASLAGYLRSRGIRVRSYDFNLESTLHFLSEPYLQAVYDQLCREWSALNGLTTLAGAERDRLVALANGLTTGAQVASSIQRAVASFRDESFYDLEQHRRNAATVARAWDLISLAHHPSRIGLQQFKPAQDTQSLGACLAAAEDSTTNPYVPYMRAEAVPKVLAWHPSCIAMIYVHPDQVVPLFTLLVALRTAGYTGHVTVLGNLEDQVTFSRYLRFERHRDYDMLFGLVDSVVYYDAEVAAGAADPGYAGDPTLR
jgi:anaerobic magnesium-protoporphyrin IX monomethyl ester cyclase